MRETLLVRSRLRRLEQLREPGADIARLVEMAGDDVAVAPD
jgi:hypothetical protein